MYFVLFRFSFCHGGFWSSSKWFFPFYTLNHHFFYIISSNLSVSTCSSLSLSLSSTSYRPTHLQTLNFCDIIILWKSLFASLSRSPLFVKVLHLLDPNVHDIRIHPRNPTIRTVIPPSIHSFLQSIPTHTENILFTCHNILADIISPPQVYNCCTRSRNYLFS